MRRLWQRLEHQKTVRLYGLGVAPIAAYIFSSLAIDTGAIWQYLLAALFVFATINLYSHQIRTALQKEHGAKPRRKQR